jgi:hypothetical protein
LLESVGVQSNKIRASGSLIRAIATTPVCVDPGSTKGCVEYNFIILKNAIDRSVAGKVGDGSSPSIGIRCTIGYVARFSPSFKEPDHKNVGLPSQSKSSTVVVVETIPKGVLIVIVED